MALSCVSCGTNDGETARLGGSCLWRRVSEEGSGTLYGGGVGETTSRINASGSQTSIKPRSNKVDGIAFGYMEEPCECCAVIVENVVLRRPVKLIETRHMDGKSFGPSSSLFGDESARRLLDDIILANPSQKNELSSYYQKISPPPASIDQ